MIVEGPPMQRVHATTCSEREKLWVIGYRSSINFLIQLKIIQISVHISSPIMQHGKRLSSWSIMEIGKGMTIRNFQKHREPTKDFSLLVTFSIKRHVYANMLLMHIKFIYLSIVHCNLDIFQHFQYAHCAPERERALNNSQIGFIGRLTNVNLLPSLQTGK